MMVRRRDPFESAIESALQPGHFIAWNQESAFVAGLEEAERGVSTLTNSDRRQEDPSNRGEIGA